MPLTSPETNVAANASSFRPTRSTLTSSRRQHRNPAEREERAPPRATTCIFAATSTSRRIWQSTIAGRSPRSPKPIPSRFRRRARWQGKVATGSASVRAENGDRERKGGDQSEQHAAGREGGQASDPEDKRKAERQGGESSGYLELLLRADATATTMMHSSPRRPAFWGVRLSVTVSIGRKI